MTNTGPATSVRATGFSMRSAGFAVHAVGDCRGVGYIEGAMRSAAEAAAAISAS